LTNPARWWAQRLSGEKPWVVLDIARAPHQLQPGPNPRNERVAEVQRVLLEHPPLSLGHLLALARSLAPVRLVFDKPALIGSGYHPVARGHLSRPLPFVRLGITVQ